jgi:hypothetical protein
MKIFFLTAIATATCALFPATTFAADSNLEITEDQQEISISDDISAQTQHYNYNFGRVRINRSESTSFTLRNRGNYPIYINDINISGESFQENDNCPRILLRGYSCRIRVRFQPYYVGFFQGRLEVNLTPAEDIRVNLRGRGVRGNNDGGGDWGIVD